MDGTPEGDRGDLQGCCHTVSVINGFALFLNQDQTALHYLS